MGQGAVVVGFMYGNGYWIYRAHFSPALHSISLRVQIRIGIHPLVMLFGQSFSPENRWSKYVNIQYGVLNLGI